VRGRQGDRPKIARAPEEIIRVRVIDEPLVSQDDFDRAQRIMEVRRGRHWKARPDFHHRFGYNGFLTCAACDQPVQTASMGDGYYVCKGRRQLKECDSPYMRRDTLDAALDSVFAGRLTEGEFLRGLAGEMKKRSESDQDLKSAARLEAEIGRLRSKRERIMESYFEGVIGKEERDARLGAVRRDEEKAQAMLARVRPPAALRAADLADAFAPFFEWGFLARDDRRRLLSTVVPEIRVAAYKLEGVYLALDSGRSNNGTHTGRGSSKPPT
jgi:hypothetical protein